MLLCVLRSGRLLRSLGPGGFGYSLQQLSRLELEEIAAARVPESLAPRLEQGSLPPALVATRSLAIAAQGHPEPWATSFLIVRNDDTRIVGGCGFKTFPKDGRVEVGYGVAPDAQGRGAATEALKLLVTKAFEAGVAEVLAEVTPMNMASVHVVQKAGFVQAGSRVDDDHEYVVQWVMRRETWALLVHAS